MSEPGSLGFCVSVLFLPGGDFRGLACLVSLAEVSVVGQRSAGRSESLRVSVFSELRSSIGVDGLFSDGHGQHFLLYFGLLF